MLVNILLISLLAFVSCGTIPGTINELKLDSYLGHWFQVYGAPTNTIFQGYGTCLTADYGLLENGKVSVLNAQLDKNHNVESISGYAYYKNITEPGKLTVHLDGVPTDSPYWIIKLGELVNNEYQYSIISVPSGISLWVITRDVEKFYDLYAYEVKEFLEKYNFKYVSITQTNCN